MIRAALGLSTCSANRPHLGAVAEVGDDTCRRTACSIKCVRCVLMGCRSLRSQRLSGWGGPPCSAIMRWSWALPRWAAFCSLTRTMRRDSKRWSAGDRNTCRLPRCAVWSPTLRPKVAALPRSLRPQASRRKQCSGTTPPSFNVPPGFNLPPGGEGVGQSLGRSACKPAGNRKTVVAESPKSFFRR